VIVSDAMSYVGGPYVWGASGPPGSGNDCSGLVNHVLGADLHMGIPGHSDGQYSGHGPVTGQYYIWSGATTVPAAQMEPGDLCCWPTHIGIATGDGQMISALNPSAGVVVTTVQGGAPIGEPLLVRRLKALTQAQALPSGKLTALTKTGGL
jgi:peptidoglycan DL-endopeptidase CwlO